MDPEKPRRSRRWRILVATGAALLAVAVAMPTVGATAKTKRVSVRSNGVEANEGSSHPAVSASGRYVAFASEASNLVKKDTNGWDDVFVNDRATGKTTRISVRTNGAQGNESSGSPAVSAGGRFVAFQSHASDLVKGDTNGMTDIFVHDRKSGKAKRVSVRSSGAQGNGNSITPSISADGRFVAFQSTSTNLVGGDTNLRTDIFVRDRKKGKTRRVSIRSNGDQGDANSTDPSISANGRYVVFTSFAKTLIGSDNNDAGDVFVWDRKSGKIRLVSKHSSGAQGNGPSRDPAISADGQRFAYASDASNLVNDDTNGTTDILWHDRRNGKTRRVSLKSNGFQADKDVDEPVISGSGRYIAFESFATNLVNNDTNGQRDIFFHDRKTGKTRRASVRSNGKQANHGSHDAAYSTDGRFVVFASSATNLVNGDTSTDNDIFRRGPLR